MVKQKGMKEYENEKKLLKRPFIMKYSRAYLRKARTNLATMSILHNLMYNSKARDALNAPSNYAPVEWVIISGYYAMYMSACSILASVGYRSYDHTATICALDELFVKKEKLEPEYISMLKNAQLEQKYVDDLRIAKQDRQIAQYDVTRETTAKIADNICAAAPKFVNRFNLLLDEIG